MICVLPRSSTYEWRIWRLLAPGDLLELPVDAELTTLLHVDAFDGLDGCGCGGGAVSSPGDGEDEDDDEEGAPLPPLVLPPSLGVSARKRERKKDA